MDGTQLPDYNRCVAIVTAAALAEMRRPGLLALSLPVAVGFAFRFIGSLQGRASRRRALGMGRDTDRQAAVHISRSPFPDGLRANAPQQVSGQPTQIAAENFRKKLAKKLKQNSGLQQRQLSSAVHRIVEDGTAIIHALSMLLTGQRCEPEPDELEQL